MVTPIHMWQRLDFMQRCDFARLFIDFTKPLLKSINTNNMLPVQCSNSAHLISNDSYDILIFFSINDLLVNAISLQRMIRSCTYVWILFLFCSIESGHRAGVMKHCKVKTQKVNNWSLLSKGCSHLQSSCRRRTATRRWTQSRSRRSRRSSSKLLSASITSR